MDYTGFNAGIKTNQPPGKGVKTMRRLREFIELFWANLEFFLDTKLDVFAQLVALFLLIMLIPAAIILLQMLFKIMNSL